MVDVPRPNLVQTRPRERNGQVYGAGVAVGEVSPAESGRNEDGALINESSERSWAGVALGCGEAFPFATAGVPIGEDDGRVVVVPVLPFERVAAAAPSW